MTRRRGFTLIELLIVVAIIGIIVAIAIVNMINAIQRAKQKRSMGDMKSLATAVEAYATDQNYYPAAAGFTLPVGPLAADQHDRNGPDSLSPTYLRVVPLVDGWSSYFTYGTSPARSDFALCSAGADGALDASPAWGDRRRISTPTSSSSTALSCSFPRALRSDRRGAGPTNGGPASPHPPTKIRRPPGIRARFLPEPAGFRLRSARHAS